MPAVYAGQPRHERRARAAALLARLGLAGRLQDTPNQLSGGQQQRVSIARALINGGQVILADEPTGALDSASGEDVLSILRELHQQGHTIVLVTHDKRIAQQAERIIELHDGEIVADHHTATRGMKRSPTTTPAHQPGRTLTHGYDRLQNAFRMALRAMNAQRMRTFLTMLGIIIGIASVVSVVALGKGSQQQVLEHINAMGTSTLEIFPGKDFGDMRSAAIQTLRSHDLPPLEQQPYIHSVTPTVSTSATLRYASHAVSVSVNGVGEQFFYGTWLYLVAREWVFTAQRRAPNARGGYRPEYPQHTVSSW
ncbi:hypothetical protein DZJ_01090 [Dickeya ananatis]